MESRNYDIRRHVLQYDDVMNQQRNIIYGQRREVLEGGDMRARIHGDAQDAHHRGRGPPRPRRGRARHWDIAGLSEYLEHLCIDKGGVQKVFDELPKKDKKDFVDALDARAQKIYELREKMWEDNKLDMREFERVALLGAVDRRWMDHIDAMTELRDGIGLRALGPARPDRRVQARGLRHVRGNGAHDPGGHAAPPLLRRARAAPLLERRQVAHARRRLPRRADGQGPPAQKAAVKVGRNDPCPCGSGKKYKNCCGRNAG